MIESINANEAKMSAGDPSQNISNGDVPSANSSDNSDNPQGAAPQNAAIEALKKQVQDLEAQVKDKEAKYLYLYADFDNFKKRSIKERSDLIKFGWESVARDILQNVDDLERALCHIPQNVDKSLKDGLNMILNQLKSTLQRQGVQPIESLNKEFDPNFHEAVGQEPSDQPSGVIVQEHHRGYTLHGRLLRPARVVISSGRSS